MAADYIIETEGLHHIYEVEPPVHALKGIDFKVKRGSVVGCIGQNGCGKTTLVRHFPGLLRPTQGVIRINGEENGKKPIWELSRSVGYVFQNPNNQIFADKVRKELEFGLKNLKLRGQQLTDRVDEVLDFFEIKHLEKKHPYTIGMGYRKLIAVASVFAMRPEAIILDEPTTGADHVGIENMGEMVKAMNKEGITMMVITHDQKFIADYTEEVIVMSDGEILTRGHPSEVYQKFDIMSETNLRPPQVTELSSKLSKFGINPGTLSPDEFADQVAQKLGMKAKSS